MPRYDYRCDSCGTAFEIERSMFDETPVGCSSCGAAEARRVFTPPGSGERQPVEFVDDEGTRHVEVIHERTGERVAGFRSYRRDGSEHSTIRLPAARRRLHAHSVGGDR